MSIPQETTSKYGTVGLHVGGVGRWSRLIFGLLILLPLVISIIQDFRQRGLSMTFYGLTALYFVIIVVVYSGVYWLLGERLFAKVNPWLNTLILVGPAIAVAWWDFLVSPFINFRLPGALQLAMGLYIGISLLLQWRIKYGGCEVVSIPILLFKKRYTIYCIPIVAMDAIEKVVIDKTGKSA